MELQMFHAFLHVFDRHEHAMYLILWAYLALFWSLRYGWFFWRRRQRYNLTVTLDTTGAAVGQLTVTVINRSRRAASIRKISLNVDSADLNRKTQGELKERIEMRSQVEEPLNPGQSATFDLHRRRPDHDEVYPLHYGELVSDLDELGIEIAELSALVLDDKSQIYESNTMRIPVYQLVAPSSENGLGRQSVTAG